MVRSYSILSRILLVVLLAIAASDCSLIGGIFNSGFGPPSSSLPHRDRARRCGDEGARMIA
jgi:hypothetical protein